MATRYGANATLRDNSEPADKINSREDNGRLRVAFDSYTISGAAGLTAADVIKMMKLPKGCKVYDVILHSEQLGSGGGNGELDVGYEANGVDAVDVDAFINGAEVGSAAFDGNMAADRTLEGNGFVPGADTQVIITANETIDDGDGKVISLWIYYALD